MIDKGTFLVKLFLVSGHAGQLVEEWMSCLFPYSTVTLLARFRGKSMGQPLSLAV